MSDPTLTAFTTDFLTEALYGLGMLAFVLLLDTFLFIQIFLGFRRSSERGHGMTSFMLTWRFMVCVLLLCIVQLLSILLWAGALHAGGLVDDLTKALLFSASCYTTLGVYSDTLPVGRRFLAFYIAICGLFTFAMATTAMMGMIGSFARAAQPAKRPQP